jgi:cyanophycinase
MYKKGNEWMRVSLENSFKRQAAPGALVLVGGRESSESIFRDMIDKNGAKSVAIIPTASSAPLEIMERYRSLFGKLVADVRAVSIVDKRDANSHDYVSMLTDCDLYFFTGGDQEKLVDVFEGSSSLEAIRRRHGTGATVAGTSAGASALAPWIIYSAEDSQYDQGPIKGSVSVSRGFDFFSPLGILDPLVVDTHFLQLGRPTRVAQVFAAGRIRRAIGISENTCATITGDRKMRVSGDGTVVALDGERVYASNHSDVEDGALVTVGAVIHDYLSAGASFDLDSWRVETCR